MDRGFLQDRVELGQDGGGGAQIIQGKITQHNFLFAHHRMRLAVRENAEGRVAKYSSLAVAQIINRGPQGNYSGFQRARASAQPKQAGVSGLLLQQVFHGMKSNRKLLNFSEEDSSPPDSRVHVHLQANRDEASAVAWRHRRFVLSAREQHSHSWLCGFVEKSTATVSFAITKTGQRRVAVLPVALSESRCLRYRKNFHLEPRSDSLRNKNNQADDQNRSE
jgi:hypothetical protein